MEKFVTLPDGKLSNVFEAYIAWKNKAGKLEAENEVLVELIHRMMMRFDLIGEMDEYFGSFWYEMDDNIKNVIVQRNVTALGGK